MSLTEALRNRRTITNSHGAVIGHVAHASTGAWVAITASGVTGWPTTRSFRDAALAEAWLRERAA